jgi:hypothetical protein
MMQPGAPGAGGMNMPQQPGAMGQGQIPPQQPPPPQQQQQQPEWA